MAEIENSADDFIPFRTVPASWLEKRMIGTAFTKESRFADVYSSPWVSHVRRYLESTGEMSRLVANDDLRFDLSRLFSLNRPLTQRVASFVYELGYDGIYYPSRHGLDLQNWAVFEPFCFSGEQAEELSLSDPDFQSALNHFRLKIDDKR